MAREPALSKVARLDARVALWKLMAEGEKVTAQQRAEVLKDIARRHGR